MVERRIKMTLHVRTFVIFHQRNGKLYGEIGNMINKNDIIVRNIIKRFENEGRTENKIGR